MNWEEIVKAQHQLIQKNTALYVTVIGLVITAVKAANFIVVTPLSKNFFVVAIASILVQLPLSELLLCIEREANWEDREGVKRRIKQDQWRRIEKPVRWIVWFVGASSAVSLAVGIGSVIQNTL